MTAKFYGWKAAIRPQNIELKAAAANRLHFHFAHGCLRCSRLPIIHYGECYVAGIITTSGNLYVCQKMLLCNEKENLQKSLEHLLSVFFSNVNG